MLQARELRRTTLSLQEPVGGEDGVELGELIPRTPPTAPDARAESAALRAEVRAALAAFAGARARRDRWPATGSTRIRRPSTETARRLGLRAGEVRRLEALALRKLRAAPETAALAA